MKKTAIEWLIIEINKLTGLSIQIDEPIIEQALKMEKEQHGKTWAEGLFCHTGDLQEFHNYYDKTYNNEQGK